MICVTCFHFHPWLRTSPVPLCLIIIKADCQAFLKAKKALIVFNCSSNLYKCPLKKKNYNFLFERHTQRKGGRQGDRFSLIYSLTLQTACARVGLDLAEVGSQRLNPDPPMAESLYSGDLLLPRVCISRKLASGVQGAPIQDYEHLNC